MGETTSRERQLSEGDRVSYVSSTGRRYAYVVRYDDRFVPGEQGWVVVRFTPQSEQHHVHEDDCTIIDTMGNALSALGVEQAREDRKVFAAVLVADHVDRAALAVRWAYLSAAGHNGPLTVAERCWDHQVAAYARTALAAVQTIGVTS